MAVKHSKVDVGTTAASLVAAIPERTGQPWERTILVSNEGTSPVFLGGSNVTTTSYGYKLAAGSDIALDLAPTDEPYAIAASGTQTVRVLHTGV